MPKNPDHSAQLNRINRIIGQLQGVKRMIEDKEYCPNILTQTKAIASALRSLECTLLDGHINHCVKNAFEKKSGAEEKANELVEIFRARLK
ncbi:metal-sensitive transcriptional regulator [bacterium]|nr:metal-sensitive transcriptional regulator [bacterium]